MSWGGQGRTDLANRALDKRRWRDFAIASPILGIFLLVSPFVTLFAGNQIFGMPLVFVYVYGIWALLILLARRIARRIDAQDNDA